MRGNGVDWVTKETRKYDAVIIGLGKTGLSCARFLTGLGKRIAVTDTLERPSCLQQLRHELPNTFTALGGIDATLLADAAKIIVSPGVSIADAGLDKIADHNTAIIGDIELFCRYADAPIIAITGSNGKSTVTTLVAKIAEYAGLDVRVGGNLGTPALELLDGRQPDYYVLELSSFQLETTHSLNAYIGAVLNITEDHMDRYSGFNAYADAKKKIFNGDGVMVINADDEVVNAIDTTGRSVVKYSVNSPLDRGFYIGRRNGEEFLFKDDQALIRRSDLHIKGDHNVSNVLAAMAITNVIKVSSARVKQTLEKFSGLPHRCEFVGIVNGLEWYNDSKATNVGACCAAIKGLANGKEIILIAGGDGKNADFSALPKAMKDRVSNAILFGKDAQKIADHIRPFIPIRLVDNMHEAVLAANEMAQSNNKVLFSPACSSLDMFENYQQRGETFIHEVKALG